MVKHPAAVLVAAAGFSAAIGLHAFDQTLDPASIAQAVDIGQTRFERVQTDFHRPYRIDVARPPVDDVEVVTPFRRIVLDAESRIRSGNHIYGQREARETLGDRPEQVDLLVELTFHPQNNYIGVPGYEAVLVPAGGGPAVPSRDIVRVPRYGLRVQGIPLPYPYSTASPPLRGSDALMGGTLIVQIDGRALKPSGACDLIVMEGKKELARARIDFGKLR